MPDDVPGSAKARRPPQDRSLLVVRRGTAPLILSAPHGGSQPIPGAALRTGAGKKQFATVRDTGTDSLALGIADALAKKHQLAPWVVVANFDRKFCDANRPEEDGVESEAAAKHHRGYHAALREAVDAVRAAGVRGLLVDVHGQAAQADAVFRGTANLKTVQRLRERESSAGWSGANGILARLGEAKLKLVPEAADGVPEDARFNGGHIVRRYSGADGLDALQLEFGAAFRNKENRAAVAERIAAAMALFAKDFLPPPAPNNGDR